MFRLAGKLFETPWPKLGVREVRQDRAHTCTISTVIETGLPTSMPSAWRTAFFNGST